MRQYFCLAFFLALLSAPVCAFAAECPVPSAGAPASDAPSCQSDGKSEKPVQQPKDDKSSQPENKQAARYVRITKQRSFSGGMPSAALRVRYELEDDSE
jgi:hypothetical protein